VNEYGLFAQAEFTYSHVDFYFALMLSQTQFWRTGNMQNGKFPDDSYGDSDKHNFTDYGIKGGVTYKINGKNYVSANGVYMTRAPNFRNSFISPRTRNFVVDNLINEKILGGDINYVLRTSFIKARLSFYYTYFQDQTWARSFYHEDLNSFVNYQMTGVDKISAGMELGIEANITSSIALVGVFGKGQHIYNSRPIATVSRDNDAEILSNRKVYLKNYYVGGSPQTAGSIGVKYNSSNYWWLGINFNCFDDIYLEPNPDRRTEEAVSQFTQDDVRVAEVLNQEKLESQYTLDLYGGKSFRIDDYYLSLNVSVSNLLNNKSFATGGYEQFRYDPTNIDKFAPKYFYLYGLTYFINLSFRF